MKSWHFRNAEAPCVVFMNGIGDHVLVLPAIRALVSLYPRRLKIVAHRAVAELFFDRLAAERIVAVQSYAFAHVIGFHFDVEAVVREIDAADLFISLSTGRSGSITDLRHRLAPRLSIGFFDEFDLVALRPRGTHSARWYFDLVRLLDTRLRFSDFTAP